MRTARGDARRLICVCHFSPVVRYGYRIGVPAPGRYREILNTDSEWFGGSNVGNGGSVEAEAVPRHGFDYSVSLTLPPIAVLWLEAP
jgi:1,4-alpha-glucan branching enzyme